jgi:IclR family transcriptional regulator, pca regulon regulatory protein
MTPRPSRTAPDGSRFAWWLIDVQDPRYSQSLARGLAVLSCFTPERPVLGIADIGDQLDMRRSTVHRYAITLVALGYLEQDSSRKYRLGLRVTDLGMSALRSTGLREHAHSHLEQLRLRTGYTASLAVLDGTDILYVDRVRRLRRESDSIDLGLSPGSRLPAYCTAMGKLLLAHVPEAEQDRLLAEMKLAKRAPNTITAKTPLREELRRVREDDFAVNDQELAAGLHAIAAPVRDESREVVAAVALATGAARVSLEDLVDALGPHLISTADQISARLGWRRDDEAVTGR